ncbi:MAG: tetratricopeptide repeat protein [Pyrinomonadaceae bacterium]|nr:tetratricopeptide repeat protein [Pyrinomonadaceae bacterium]
MTENIEAKNEGSNRELAVVAAIFVLVLAVYYQTVGFDFITFDDNLYVYQNPAVLSGLNSESIKWAFTAFHSANWHPLTWLSHMLDVTLFGRNAGGHHGMNVMLHLGNSLLSFAVFRRMTERFWPSAVIAVLFAVHPAHVESVAWVSERKDVLSTALMLLTIWAYADYAKGDAAEGKAFWRSNSYYAVFVLFALGLMAKPMLVTLPFVLLLFDHWPLGRVGSSRDLKALVIEKLPLFALTALSCVMTFSAQRSGGAVSTLSYLSLDMRVMNALISYVKYIGVMFYPSGLAVFYPYPDAIPVWQAVAAAILLAAITAACIALRNSHRYLLIGWLFFLGTLVPVIGLVQVGGQAMADRYTYVPYFGLFIMLAFGLDAVFGKARQNVYIAVFGIAAVVFAVVAYMQAGYWRNSETVYKRALSVTERNHMAGGNLCLHLATTERPDEAEPYCRDAIAAKPDFPLSYNSLGIVKMKQKQYAEAEVNFAEYVKWSSRDPIGYANLATSQILQDRPEDAEPNLRAAAELNDGTMSREVLAFAVGDLANAYAAKGNFEKAAESFSRQVNLYPDVPIYRFRLATALFELERFDEAKQQAEIAAAAAPGDADIINLIGKIYMAKGDTATAIAEFEKAVRIKPDHEQAKENLKKARGEK